MPFFRRIIASVMMAVFVFGGYAGSFSAAVDDVIEEENVEDVPATDSNTSSSSKNKSSSSSSSSSESSSFSQALFEIIFEAIGYLWLAANVSVRFYDYPYMEDGVKYVTYPALFESSGDGDGEKSVGAKPRFYRFSCGTSAFYMRTLGYGQECSFEGQALFIGPYFENTLYSNSLRNARDDYQGNVKLGGQFFLFSTNPLSCSLVVQWSHWYGNNIAEEIRSGISFGYDIRSYPFRPVAIQWRPVWSHFDKNVGVFESNLNAGILLGRIDVFCGWRYMSVYNYETDKRSDKWNGALVGAKLYF